MSINVGAIAKVIGKAIVVEGPKALAIAEQIPILIELAENLYDGLKGADKLAAVQAGLWSFVEELDPKIAENFTKLWSAAKPMISVIVTIYHFAGIFGSKTPAKA